jgi:hypothetical protein
MPDQLDLRDIMHREIALVQDVIKRMASNSFFIKGWTITLVAATLILKGSKIQTLIAFIPLFGFWFLDSYYLRQERLYRKLYEWVIKNRTTDATNCYDLSTKRFKKDVHSIFRIVFSQTIFWFYFPILLIILIYGYLTIFTKCGG